MSHTIGRGLFFLLLAGLITGCTSVIWLEEDAPPGLFLSVCDRALLLAAGFPNEKDANDAFCAQVGGQREVRHDYGYPTGSAYVVVDCETKDRVYEGGLDKRSSLDSVQQALFFAHVTGKEPAVVIYDTDGQIGPYEYRIRAACALAEVEYLTKDLCAVQTPTSRDKVGQHPQVRTGQSE